MYVVSGGQESIRRGIFVKVTDVEQGGLPVFKNIFGYYLFYSSSITVSGSWLIGGDTTIEHAKVKGDTHPACPDKDGIIWKTKQNSAWSADSVVVSKYNFNERNSIFPTLRCTLICRCSISTKIKSQCLITVYTHSFSSYFFKK